MPTIEINTSQNVRIQYEVANFGDRAFALLIDLLVIGGAALVSMLFSAMIAGDSTSYVFYLLLVPFGVFYSLISESLMKGQTLGKKALNIQVVKLNGTEAKTSDYFFRWIFRMIDIYLSFGILATVFVATSKKGQRLGDLVGETSVIRIKPSSKMQFYEMMEKINSDHYEPQFPQVKRLTEEDMLFVQSSLLRYHKYKNEAHQEVLSELSTKIRNKLEISAQDGLPDDKFLSLLLKDYVITTR